MPVNEDCGRIIATPYKNDTVRLAVQIGEDGLGYKLFRAVFLWPNQNNAVSTLNGVKPFKTMPEARKWLDDNHETVLANYRRYFN